RRRAPSRQHRAPGRRSGAEAGRTALVGMSVAIGGGGSWGTALAIHVARSAGPVRLWARETEVVAGIRARRRSPWYLADINVLAAVEATTDMGEALHAATLVIVVVPSEFVAATLKLLPPIPPDVPVLSATKGFDPERHRRVSEVIAEQFPDARVAVLSGPTYARAALITRGLAEMTRLAVSLGATSGTMAGLAGLGDLVLTCTGSLSRNRQLGMALAKGESKASLERETRMIAEGARTVTSALA